MIRRVHRRFLALLLAFAPALVHGADDGREIVRRMAERYGLEAFEQAERLRFTFNVVRDDRENLARTWIWRPDAKRVTWEDRGITYTRETDAADPSVDQKFINDSYWLVFPFHLARDPDVTLKPLERAKSPIRGEPCNVLRVSYGDSAGYTPGDVYTLYYNDAYVIREWVYQSGGEGEGWPVAWGQPERVGGVLIHKRFTQKDGSVKIRFTDVSIR